MAHNYFGICLIGCCKLKAIWDNISVFIEPSPEMRWGWSGSAKVLAKLPVPGRPTTLITVGQGPTALVVGAGRGCLDIFTLIFLFSFLSPSLWETARYRLKYCLKGPLKPKQPPPASTASAVDPCYTKIPISRTSRHWKITRHHRTTRPPNPIFGNSNCRKTLLNT